MYHDSNFLLIFCHIFLTRDKCWFFAFSFKAPKARNSSQKVPSPQKNTRMMPPKGKMGAPQVDDAEILQQPRNFALDVERHPVVDQDLGLLLVQVRLRRRKGPLAGTPERIHTVMGMGGSNVNGSCPLKNIFSYTKDSLFGCHLCSGSKSDKRQKSCRAPIPNPKYSIIYYYSIYNISIIYPQYIIPYLLYYLGGQTRT